MLVISACGLVQAGEAFAAFGAGILGKIALTVAWSTPFLPASQ
ncbi:hypothetical protein AB0J21_32410 [Streptomyces sp. NPDC049954]